jgi:hypothetical protein
MGPPSARWRFAEFTEVYEIEREFGELVNEVAAQSA